ncbi:MAG: RNA pseudouridine synthase [Bdellovibrionales bacterium]|nr:RNA pseudouridine synthase [Bdellovibrionales bacterium]
MFVEPIVLWENDSLLILEKPPGLPSVEGKKTCSSIFSVTSWLKERSISASFPFYQHSDGGLCHRLDTETSGLMVAAKTIAAYESLRSLFSNQRISKGYLAIVEGRPKNSNFQDAIFSGRYRRSQKVSVRPVPIQPSTETSNRSQYGALLWCLDTHLAAFNASLLSIDLFTGVRHQIRAQLAFLGHPLLGDSLYGSKRALEEVLQTTSPFPSLKRDFFLHADRISFSWEGEENDMQYFSPASLTLKSSN